MKENIILFAGDINRAKAEIQSLGGQVTQQFTSRVFVAKLPEKVDPASLKESTTKKPSDLDDISKLTLAAWEASQEKSNTRSPSQTEGLDWDAPGFTPPEFLEEVESGKKSTMRSADIQESTGTGTSLYMTGSIAVGVVIVAGTGSGLGFSNEENQKVIQEVMEGLNFLADAEPRAKITFTYDIHLETVSAPPGSTANYESAEGPWRNAALQNMGFDASRQGSIDYVNQLRQNKGTNWAYVAYFTKYPLKHFAYAVSEKTVMHYNNDGWGIDNINRVFAHETCHIFGAADEYGSCACGGSHGHLGIPNNNCKNCATTQETCLMSGNDLQLCNWSRKQLGWDESLFPEVHPPLTQGNYTVQQKSNNRYMDAHDSSGKDFSAVTRTAQNNSTQKWKFNVVGTIYTIQQKSNDRFADAYGTKAQDFNCVTRPAQNNDSQRWALLHSPGLLATYTIQQLENGQYLDAWTTSGKDFSVVTRPAQNNNTQRWILEPLGNQTFTIRQRVNGRFLDAHEVESKDFSMVTRPGQDNDTQKWILKPIGSVYTIQQVSSGRFLDAHENSEKDFSVVTRTAQNNATQYWVVIAQGDDTFTIQQLSNGRYLDAHEDSANDFNIVTRTRQNNNTQKWIIKLA